MNSSHENFIKTKSKMYAPYRIGTRERRGQRRRFITLITFGVKSLHRGNEARKESFIKLAD